MNADIENIITIEKRNKVCTKRWRNIYEIIEYLFLKETDIFPDDLKKVKANANEALFLPLEVKNNI